MYKITIEQDFNKIMRRIQMCFIYIYAMSWPRAVLLRFFLHFFLFMYVQLQTEDWAGERATKQKLNRTETEGKEKLLYNTGRLSQRTYLHWTMPIGRR